MRASRFRRRCMTGCKARPCFFSCRVLHLVFLLPTPPCSRQAAVRAQFTAPFPPNSTTFFGAGATNFDAYDSYVLLQVQVL